MARDALRKRHEVLENVGEFFSSFFLWTRVLPIIMVATLGRSERQ